jgi:LmbE family N-acetylglucosaminyl deacetylase
LASRLRVLGVFAHPDDEVFCVGGTLARYTSEGAEAMVVSVTRGEAGQIRDANVATRRTLGATRAEELHRSCAQLGVQHVRCLDYGDGKLATLAPNVLVREVTAIIREFRPHVVLTFDETGAYGHPDHIAISHATSMAYTYAGNPVRYPEQRAEGLEPHRPERLYHSFFPRNDRLLLRLIVEWLQSLDARFRGSEEFLHGLMLFADESSMLGYAADHLEVAWYPRGFYIIEQGEPAVSLYLVLSGAVDIFIEDDTGNSRYIETHGPGVFIGETGLAYGKPRNAHVVAAENTTCLVFSPGEPTNFAGRGEEAGYATSGDEPRPGDEVARAHVCIDVRPWVERKIAALSEHRTQYPVTREMFPRALLSEVLGKEYFVQVQPALTPVSDLIANPARNSAHCQATG